MYSLQEGRKQEVTYIYSICIYIYTCIYTYICILYTAYLVTSCSLYIEREQELTIYVIYIHTYIRRYTCMYIRTYIYVYLYNQKYIHIYIHIYTYTYISDRP